MENKYNKKSKISLSTVGLCAALGLIVIFPPTRSDNQILPVSNATAQEQPQHQYRDITGVIKSVDEDSFAIFRGEPGVNFEFENLRIEDFDGKLYKLVNPGPTNYQVGDSVNLKYRVQSKVTHDDILSYNKFLPPDNSLHPVRSQKFSLDVDGIIVN